MIFVSALWPLSRINRQLSDNGSHYLRRIGNSHFILTSLTIKLKCTSFIQRKIVVDALRQLTAHHPEASAEPSDSAEQEGATSSSSLFRAPLSSPAPSNYSTDTASECGSAFNSPNPRTIPPPTPQHRATDLANSTYVKDFSRLVVVKMSGQKPPTGNNRNSNFL